MAVPASVGIQAARAGAALPYNLPALTPEEESSFMTDVAGVGISGLSAVGNLLDVPGSMIRDTLAWKNPFDQLLTPFSGENRTTGRDLLEGWNILDPNRTGFDAGDVAGFGAEVLLDPLSYLTMPLGALGKGGKLAEKAGVLDDILKKALPDVGPRQARMQTTLDDLIRHASPEQMIDMDFAARGLGYKGVHEAAKDMQGPLGGLVGFGVPFKDPSTAFGSGEWAQKAAGVLDATGEAIRYGNIPGTEFSPGRLFGQMFDYTSRGLGGKLAQKYFGPESVKLAERAVSDTAEFWAEDVRTFDNFLQGLEFADDKIAAYGELRKAFEGGPLSQRLQDAGLGLTVQKHRQFMDNLLKAEQANGLTTKQLDDISAEYAHRRMFFFKDKGPGKGSGNRLFSGKHAGQIGRKKFMKHLEGNSDLINELSMDPEFSGIIHEMTPQQIDNPKFWDDQVKKLGDKMKTMGIDPDARVFLESEKERIARSPFSQLEVTDDMLDILRRNAVPEDKIQKWLDQDKTKGVLDSLNEGSANPVSAVQLWQLRKAAGKSKKAKLLWKTMKGALDEEARKVGLPKFDMDVAIGKPTRNALVDELEKQAKRTANMTHEDTKDFVEWLAHLDPLHARYEPGTEYGKIPVFPHNPIEEAIIRAEIGQRAIGLAKMMRDVIGDPNYFGKAVKKKAAKVGAVSAKELFEKAGLDPEKSIDLLHQDWHGRAAGVEREAVKLFREYQGGMTAQRQANLSEAARLSDELNEMVSESSKEYAQQLGYDPRDLDSAIEEVYNSKVEAWNDPARDTIRKFRKRYLSLTSKAQKDVDAHTLAKRLDEIAEGLRQELSGKGQIAGHDLDNLTTDDVFELLKQSDPKPRRKDPDMVREAEDMLRERFQPEGGFDEGGEFAGFNPSAFDEADEGLAPEMQILMENPKYSERARSIMGRLEELGEDSKTAREYADYAREAAVDTNKSLNDVWVDGELATELNAVIESWRNPSAAVTLAEKIIDPLNRLWQASVTRIFPAFHMRNLMAGQMQNKVIGGFSIRSFTDAHNLVQGKKTKSLLGIKGLKARTEDEAAREVANLAFSERLIDKGQGIGMEGLEFTSVDRELAGKMPGQRPHDMLGMFTGRELFPDLSQKTAFNDPGGLVSQLNPFSLEHFTGYKWGADVGSYVESLNRITPFIELMRKGYSPREAARRVRAAQFDYTKLTQMEKKVFRRIIPFWTFSKNQAKFTLNELSRRPGGLMAQFGIRAPNNAREQGKPLPEYLSQTASIPLGTLPSGSDRYITGLGMSHEDPLSFLGVRGGLPDVGGMFSEMISRTSPLIKGPIETAAGESFFQRGPLGGRELVDMDPTIGRLLSNVGLTKESPTGRAEPFISTGFENLVANSPFSRMLTTARTLTDPRKWEGDLGGWAAGLQLGTGVRVSDLSPAARDAVIRDEATAAMRELGAKTWEQTVFSKGQIEKAAEENPELARQMLKYNRLQKYLAQRSKDRKERAEKDLK